MSSTQTEIQLSVDAGWALVLAVPGFIVVNDPYEFEFFYTEIDGVDVPNPLDIGNITEARVIENDSTSRLWIRTKHNITIVVNVEKL